MTALAAALVAVSALAANPEVAAEHWKLAQDYLARGLVRHAEEEARVTLALDPAHAEARALLAARGHAAEGSAASALGAEARRAYRASRIEDARTLALRALKDAPADPEARAVLAALDEEAWTPGGSGDDEVLRGLFEQGLASWRRDAWGAAAEAFQKALASAPSHEQIRSFYARARDRADAAYINASLARARQAAKAGRREEAHDWLLKVLAVRPNDPEALALRSELGFGPEEEARRARFREQFNRGVAAYEEGKWTEALRAWEVAAGLDPGDAETPRLIRKARGKLSASRAAARRRNAGLHEEALRLYQQGKHDEARAVYKRILEGDPDDERAKRGLEVLDGKPGP